jgi:hypothetical protein
MYLVKGRLVPEYFLRVSADVLVCIVTELGGYQWLGHP